MSFPQLMHEVTSKIIFVLKRSNAKNFDIFSGEFWDGRGGEGPGAGLIAFVRV